MKVLVTGAAGFIGFHVVRLLLEQGDTVIGLDNVNRYYDPSLKENRLQQLRIDSRNMRGEYHFTRKNIASYCDVDDVFRIHEFDKVIHLAAQAGVQYSLTNPEAYTEANLIGFNNIIEACKRYNVQHLTYASSSSVYGSTSVLPSTEEDNTSHPISLYAATKLANEHVAHSYSHLYGLPTTGLRLFTVYGPWGRPDMALFNFTKNILAGEPITLYQNDEEHTRDFTYINDAMRAIVQINNRPAQANLSWDRRYPDKASSNAPFRIYNVGSGSPYSLSQLVQCVEETVGKKAIVNYAPARKADVLHTHANIQRIQQDIGFMPVVSLQKGVEEFVDWYRRYHKV